MENENLLSKTIDKLFSVSKETFYLIIIFILSFIIRILASSRNNVSADEMVHGTHSIGFIASRKLQIMDQGAIWFWLNDFFMKILGVNLVGIRFSSIFFGSLLLIIIYLIGKEIFNKKVGLIASIISIISYFQLDNMEASLDITMTFFVFISFYFFILFTKKETIKYFYLIWVSIGIAVMSKPIALLFAFSLFLSSIYYHFYKNKSIRIRDYIYAGILLLIIFTPVLTFNYLLFKDKGIVDLQFARFTGISKETYSSISSTIEGFRPKSLITSENGNSPGIIKALSFIYTYESPILLFFALIGLFYLFKNKNKFSLFLITTFAIPFIFLAGTSLLPNHFIFASFYAVLISANGIVKISNLNKIKNHSKQFIYIITILILFTSYIQVVNGDVHGLFGNKDPMHGVISFKESDIIENSVVITDGRIYRGRVAFMFWDRNYFEGTSFVELMAGMEGLPGPQGPVTIYYVECIIDDCGWGTIKNQPEFNQSMESLKNLFSTQAELIKTIKGVKGEDYYGIYKGTIQMKQSALPIIRASHEWFYYPLNYEPKSRIFDNYETHNSFDKFLDLFAHLILYLEILVAGLFSFYTLYLIFKER